jgi:hypothetical protein
MSEKIYQSTEANIIFLLLLQAYIKSFLEATNISVEEWNGVLGSPSELYLLRKKCIDKIIEIDESKLELIYGLLSNF